MTVKLQVDRMLVAVETDYKPADGKPLFDILLEKAVEFMRQKMAETTYAKKGSAQ